MSCSRRKMAVRAVADGKEAAQSIACFLTGTDPLAKTVFNSRMGKLLDGEIGDISEIGRAINLDVPPLDRDGGFVGRRMRVQ